MPQERWRFNDTSYSSNTNVTSDGTNYFLFVNPTDGTLSTTTSSWEGARALVAKTSGNSPVFTKNSGGSAIDSGTYYADVMFYIDSSETNGNGWNLFLTANDGTVDYSWLNCSKNGSGNYEFKIQSYSPTPGLETHYTLTTSQACGSWVRLKVKINTKCVEWVRFWNAATVATMDAVGTNENATVTNSTEASPVTTFGTGANWLAVAPLTADATTTTARFDDLLFGNTSSLTRVPPNINAAASETASATAAATTTRVLAGAESVTATADATAGLALTAAGAPSITAAGSADAAVLTTHNAEAASTITVGTTDALSLTQGMVAASTITASSVGTMASDTDANGAVQAIATARIVIEGETSPGFLYATVAKKILTN